MNNLTLKNQFFSNNFDIFKFPVGKEINPYQTKAKEGFKIQLVKCLPTELKIASQASNFRSWYDYQLNPKYFYQLPAQNPTKPCYDWLDGFTNKMVKKSQLVKFANKCSQGLRGNKQKQTSTLYINIYINPP